MKKPLHNSVLILLVLCVLMNLCSCYNISRKEYYENVENYVGSTEKIREQLSKANEFQK